MDLGADPVWGGRSDNGQVLAHRRRTRCNDPAGDARHFPMDAQPNLFELRVHGRWHVLHFEQRSFFAPVRRLIGAVAQPDPA